ncbi:GntR family transcriptional regulator [Phytohabitans sp. ZYX-F-186]|uniref:GntR family transcriptional regulator n=1 Tax=Phytohabitans maris TaxID=3071409 RepID=A0ABU0ZAU2_9ACTN|nr:GntR family transcriptional regulator [Phytohabitans sp. ZYX-F-186]MDQ7903564.1 GntR family transcriptional regulator [Phytohabitans sp. ZYX-F-186]
MAENWTDVPTLPAAVADWIARGIVAERWPDGARLRETEIAAELGVSRGPVREALRVLGERGLVRLVPRVGAVVNGMSRDTISEVYELRAHIEALICRSAVPRLTDADKDRLRGLLDQIIALRNANRVDEMLTTCWEFRETLYRPSSNRTALDLVRSLRTRLHSIPQVLRDDPQHIALAMTFYVRVTQAAVDGDTSAVERLVSEFMIKTGEQAVAAFRPGTAATTPARPGTPAWS